MMLGGNPTATSPAATNYLYTGEQFDEHAQHYYLRARYYNPLNGRFNRMDPYAGSPQDPQSLHKYLYCHANPVNNSDPTGESAFSMVGTLVITSVMLLLMAPNWTNAPGPRDITFTDAGGDIIIDSFYMIAGALIIRYVIAPIARHTVKYAGRGLQKFRLKLPGAKGPGKWLQVRESMSPRAAAYQSKITGQPVENGYVVEKVKFDGFKGGKLLDAKGPGYKNFVNKDGRFYEWFRGQHSLSLQARRQIAAANGKIIEWHIAEEKALEAIKKLFGDQAITGINLIFTPGG